MHTLSVSTQVWVTQDLIPYAHPHILISALIYAGIVHVCKAFDFQNLWKSIYPQTFQWIDIYDIKFVQHVETHEAYKVYVAFWSLHHHQA